MYILTKGYILKVDHINTIITDEYEVLIKSINTEYDYISIGRIEDEVTYFYESNKPKINDIKYLLYLGDNMFSYKQLISPLDEINNQDDHVKEIIVDQLMNCFNKYCK
jgi:hypothetical protein